MMTRRNAKAMLRGWLHVSSGKRRRVRFRDQRGTLVRALQGVEQQHGGELPVAIEEGVRAALVSVATATGHPQRAFTIYAAAGHNVAEDGIVLDSELMEPGTLAESPKGRVQ